MNGKHTSDLIADTLENISEERQDIVHNMNLEEFKRFATENNYIIMTTERYHQIMNALQEPREISEYDKDHIWYKGHQYISLRRFLEVKAEAEQECHIVKPGWIKVPKCNTCKYLKSYLKNQIVPCGRCKDNSEFVPQESEDKE